MRTPLPQRRTSEAVPIRVEAPALGGAAATPLAPALDDAALASTARPDALGRLAAVGNSKVARAATDVAREPDPTLQGYLADPTKHPEFGTYLDLMKRAGLDDRADEVFQMVLGAFGEHASPEAHPELNKRNPSDWLVELTAYMDDALDLGGSTMALWSGGIDMSNYAFAKGYLPLEKTKLGGVLDSLKLHSSWALKAPLWNALSRAFVRHAGTTVHVFVRSVQADSVLIAEEVPGLGELEALTGKPITTAWHAVYTDPATNKHAEIDAGRNLVADFTYPTRVLAAAAIYDYNQGFPSGPKG